MTPRESALLQDVEDALGAPLRMWIHYGSGADKADLLQAYADLTAPQKAVLHRAVEAEVPTPLVAYRRVKGTETNAGTSLSLAKPPAHVPHVAYRVAADDLLVPPSWLVTHAFGHEREVLLRPGARPPTVEEHRVLRTLNRLAGID